MFMYSMTTMELTYNIAFYWKLNLKTQAFELKGLLYSLVVKEMYAL